MKLNIITCAMLAMAAINQAWAQPVMIASPDGNIEATVAPDDSGRLRYSITFKGKPVILPSTMGIIIDGKDMGIGMTLGEVKRRDFEELNKTLGNHAPRTNKGREAVVAVASGPAKTAWMLEVRVFNRGVGYRYRMPGTGARKVNGESSEWQLPAGSRIWYQPHNARGDYEAPFAGSGLLSDLKTAQVIAAPATLQLPDGLGYATITEANLIQFTDMAIEYTGENTFKAKFYIMPQGFDWNGEIVSPWRVTLIAPDLDGLVNATDVIQDLCPPPSPELASADWIKPGRAAWHWMVTGRPVLDQQRQWVDWTQQLGFEYYLIDDGWRRWTAEGKDAWACMKDVVDYAKTKNVRIWAWVNCSELMTSQERRAYFASAQAAGVVGIKIDFMDRRPGGKSEEIWWNQWYDDTLREMAEFRLMADFHGSVKPSGRERTWPHEMTRESVRGREAGKHPGIHDASLPFVRYVQGHGDYTPVDFRNSPADQRANRLRGNSFAKELAGAVIYTSPLLVFSGAPDNYLANDSIDILKTIPATWDETIVLPASSIGEVAAFARRKGTSWFIGVVNGTQARQIRIDPSFLGGGTFTIDKLADDPARNDAWNRSRADITSATPLTIDLRGDGGFVARLTPAGSR